MSEPAFNAGNSVLKLREAVVGAGALASVLVTIVLAYSGLQSDVRAVAARADALTGRHDKTDTAITKIETTAQETRDKVFELRLHQMQTAKQMDRIEVLLGGQPPARSP